MSEKELICPNCGRSVANAEGNVTIEISSESGTSIRCASCGARLSYGGGGAGGGGLEEGSGKSGVSAGGIVGGVIVALIIIYIVLIAFEVVPSPF